MAAKEAETMTIRKTGAVTGQITEVEPPPQGSITATASVRGPNPPWAACDEAALADENEAADEA